MEKYKSKRQGEMRKCCYLDTTWSLHSGTKGRFRYLSGGEQASNAIQHPNRQQSLDSVDDKAEQRQKQREGMRGKGELLEVLTGNERGEKRVTIVKMHCVGVLKILLPIKSSGA